MNFLLLGALGASLGSFLNVVIVRLPLRRSIVWPGSHCEKCQTALRWHEMVPVVSYLCLRGRCSRCQTSIPFQYVLLELVGAALLPTLYLVYGWSLDLVRMVCLTMILAAAALIDRRWGVIPNALVAPAASVGLAFAIAAGPDILASRLLAAATTGILLVGIRAGSALAFGRPGLGTGDIKLLAALALFLGWEVLWVFYLAAAGSAMVGMIGIAAGRLTRTTRIPFAPLAALAVVLDLTILPSSVLPV